MARIRVEEAEKLLDQEFKVLNKGFVRLVDYLGGDSRIVQAARVSYGQGTKSAREDSALIDYLLRNQHTSPFEQVVMTFHIKTPIFVARQWVRHRTARMNEISGRYSIMSDEFYLPDPADIHQQSKSNKQGRSAEIVSDEAREHFLSSLESDQASLYQQYETYLEHGIARELARVNLPLSLYTQFYWQIDLHNLFHFLQLRLDSHAQKEIRLYAEALAICARAVAPLAYESFKSHILEGERFSGPEIASLIKALNGEQEAIETVRTKLGVEKLHE